MSLLTLGDFDFESFEIPERIGFGGRQQLAVHKLIGGARLIDSIGQDDCAIRWSGVFSGKDASDRARELDAMRVAGLQLPLYWDAFCYVVLIEAVTFQFSNPWWVPYRISCVVVQDLAEITQVASPALADSLLSDLSFAGMYTNTTNAIAAAAVPNALIAGTAQYAAASGALQSNLAFINQSIFGYQNSLQSTDLTTMVNASGSLAQLYVAQAYVQRAAINLGNAGK
jgi:hypothetical protein